MTYTFTDDEYVDLDDELGYARAIKDESPDTAYAPVYESIYSAITETVDGTDQPKAGVDSAVWEWVAGASSVNANSGAAADFIRDYTKEQYSLRYGVSLSDVDVQLASNKIADAFASQIITDGNLPTLALTEVNDAGNIASQIFNDSLHTSLSDTADYSPWAGTLLFAFLGDRTPFENWVLNTGTYSDGTTVFKPLTGTYDLISIEEATYSTASGSILSSIENFLNNGNVIENNGLGTSATEGSLATLRSEATSFFENAYGLADTTEWQVGNYLPLYTASDLLSAGWAGLNSPHFIIGTLGNDSAILTNNYSFLINSGNDIVNAGTGDDVIYGSTGNDLIDGGPGVDTVNYSLLANGVTVTAQNFSGTLYTTRFEVDKGSSAVDYLYSIERFVTTNHTDTFNLFTPSGLTIEGNGNTIVNYTSATLDQATGRIYSADDSAYDTLDSVSSANIHGINGYRPNSGMNEALPSGYLRYDYAGATSGATFTIEESNSVTSTGFNLWTDYYTATTSQFVSVTTGGYTQSGVVGSESVSDYGLYNIRQEDKGSAFDEYVGTNHGDTVTVTGNAAFTFITGTGNDTITLDSGSTALSSDSTIIYNGGDKDIKNAGALTTLVFAPGITAGEVTVASYSGGTLVLDVAGAGSAAGTVTLEHYSSDTQIYAGGSLLNPSLPATSDGYGAGYGITPVYDNNGNVISLRLDPGVAQSYVPSTVGAEVMNPFVMIGFSTYSDGTSQHTTIFYSSYVQGIQFAPGIAPGDVWFSASTDGGNASLVVHVGSSTFTIPNFESGRTIIGYGEYGSDVHTLIQGSASGSLTAEGNYNYEGSYLGGGLGDFSLGATGTDYTEYLQYMSFANGSAIDLQGNLTFNAPSAGATIYGLESRVNTFVGHGGSDTFYGGPNNDTFIAGSGVEYMHAGAGNNTFSFASGFNNDYIYATPNAGTNTIHLSGINPANAIVYTSPYSGALQIVDMTNPSDIITVSAGVTGSGSYESTIGTYINAITFDPSYATTWDLTAGLTLTATNASSFNLYGTQYDDVLIAGTGNDQLYGNRGNDTYIAGSGVDYMYGGDGDNTFSFASGFNSDYVYATPNAGTNAIHLSGINPADIILYTSPYSGALQIVDTTNPSHIITVSAGITGNDSYESTIGHYVQQITFDGSYGAGATIDLTGGLTLTATNASSFTLYGTQYDDTLIAGTGSDQLYGNGGDNTLVAGSGVDYMYGGSGNNTFSFSAGFNSDIVSAMRDAGTNTIHLSGINPADMIMYTDPYSGSLRLVDTTNPSDTITVYAGLSGNGTYESTIGHYVQDVTFDPSYGTTWDLTGGLTLTATNASSFSLYGTQYGDTLIVGTGSDQLYGNGGDNTLVAGSGVDYLYGGSDNNTFSFSAGFNNDTVSAARDAGTNTIHLAGINPADVIMYTDPYSGTLHLVDTSDPSHNITVYAGLTGNGTYESTVGHYVQDVTFDPSYGTTWDLTGGLTLTATNAGGFNLYGTQFNDTLIAGTGSDLLYGNGGDNTLVAGSGVDYLYGGSGNNTFSFSSGFNSDQVYATPDAGTNTIHLSGIDPADVRLYTDPGSGALHLVDSANPSHSITVSAGVTGSGTYESTVGHYVQEVTFDSIYGTTWDLTGGLIQTLSNIGGTLYGTGNGDNLNGGTGSDTFYANAGDNNIYGDGGNDQIYLGTGTDTVVFKGATAETGVDTISNFDPTAKDDRIDIADVISSYDPLTMDIANFVELTTSGANTQVKVDTDGSGTSYTQIATIQGVTGLNLTDLITDGNLIVHHT